MRILRARDHRAMPWKNGQGSTTEVAVCPEGANLEEFVWRVSLATVSADGPFSVFDGIDRTLTVLRGGGIRLSVGERQAVDLTPASAPYAFAGDAPASATLLAEEILDLNVMSRRGHVTHAVRRLAIHGPVKLETQGATVLLFCAAGAIEAPIAQGSVALGPQDALLAEAIAPTRWSLAADAPSTLFSIEFFDAPGA